MFDEAVPSRPVAKTGFECAGEPPRGDPRGTTCLCGRLVALSAVAASRLNCLQSHHAITSTAVRCGTYKLLLYQPLPPRCPILEPQKTLMGSHGASDHHFSPLMHFRALLLHPSTPTHDNFCAANERSAPSGGKCGICQHLFLALWAFRGWVHSMCGLHLGWTLQQDLAKLYWLDALRVASTTSSTTPL